MDKMRKEKLIDEHGRIDIDLVRDIRGMLIEEIEYFGQLAGKCGEGTRQEEVYSNIINEKLTFIAEMEANIVKQMKATMKGEFKTSQMKATMKGEFKTSE